FYYLLIDLNGNLAFVNPLFQKEFNHLSPDFLGKQVNTIFQGEEAEKFSKTVKQCVQAPGQPCKVELKVMLAGDGYREISWEISAFAEEPGKIKMVQAIGVQHISGDGNAQESENIARKLSERYKAFEKSAEGLWMFESAEPVIITDPPEKIIEYWK